MTARILANPAALTGLVRALMILATTFGVGFTDPQIAAVIEAVGLFLAFLSLVLTGVTMRLTTPVATPVLPQGTVVEVVTPEGQPNASVTL
jgi:hypothetical protein